MQESLASAGLSLMLGNSRYDPEEELRLVRAMLSWRPAALAIVGVDHPARVVELLRAADVPVVEIWDAGSEPIDSAVGMDHLAIGRLQAEHLYERGYRRIAFVGSTREHDYRARKRRDGYAMAVGRHDLHEPIVRTAPVGGTPELGERLLGELLASEPEVDGIVCNGDVIALGVLRGLRRRGRAVPGEVGVVGFGDAEAATCVVPTLTTVRPPRADVGRIAAATLLARIDREPPRRIVLAAELIARESTARPSR
jgi:LacI family gluconate utilization system Gnt-I transcriptional repressor